jgi:prepilin-type N-terminal cleavage/methylation domain-containing protein
MGTCRASSSRRPRRLGWRADRRAALAAVRRVKLPDDAGFTLIEVLVAALVLVVGLLALFGMIIVSDHAIARDRIRQAETSLAREVLEDARSLPYGDLNTPALAGSLQPLVPNSAVAGPQSAPTLTVTRSIYTFSVALSACSMDDPSDGYGNHSLPPASGGSWCPDTLAGPSGTTDTNPDDYKRVSATVTPIGGTQTPVVQQTILIYNRPTHGPAVSCLTTTQGQCPGTSQTITSSSTTSLTFYVTTTSVADRIQWLVNGAQPPASQIASGSVDPYQPSSTTSSFTWIFPQVNGSYIDGSFTITAVAYDSNGNAGTRSTLQITIDRHRPLAPASVTAGWNQQLQIVDILWSPSIDQDVLYYQVWHQVGTQPAAEVCQTANATTTSCTDTTAPAPTEPSTCSNPPTDSGTSNQYWVYGFDSGGQGTASASVDANVCDHPPYAPTNLSGTLSGSTLTLSWTAPSPGDPDAGDSIAWWRIYRWAGGSSGQTLSNRYDLIGATAPGGGQVTSYTDSSADPGGAAQSYCVSAVDTHLNESPCSNVVTG